MKRVIIVHGWGGYPDEAWMPWLKRELEARGFDVIAPEMPDTDHPRIDAWVAKLAETVGTPDEEMHLVGHSIGCQTILRYLAERSESEKVGNVVLVAGWLERGGLQDLEPEEVPIARPWLETPFDYDRAREAAMSITAIFSDDDPVVPLENKHLFADKLGARVIVQHGKGHFSEDSGVNELPAALDALIQ